MNLHTHNQWNHYLIEPGDATAYRFGFCYFPAEPKEAYILDSGVGLEPRDSYIMAYIKMPYGTGICTLLIGQVTTLAFHKYVAGYARGHGWDHVNAYTLRAVLFALSVLIVNPEAIDEAAQLMLKAGETDY